MVCGSWASRRVNANAAAGDDTIAFDSSFNVPRTITVGGTLMTINGSGALTINGPGMNLLTVSGNNASRIFEVSNVSPATLGTVTFNNLILTEKMLPSLKRSAGNENVLLVPAQTGGEDFSYFQEKVPGLFVFLGGMTKGKDPKTAASHHTPDFFIDESGLSLGVKALTNLAIDYMEMKK